MKNWKNLTRSENTLHFPGLPKARLVGKLTSGNTREQNERLILTNNRLTKRIHLHIFAHHP